MTTLREAAQLALEALEGVIYRIERDLEHDHEWAVVEREIASEAITALRERLAEPVQEPVAWLTPRTVDSYMRPDLGYETCSKTDYAAFPVYTAPPQRKESKDD